MKQASRWPGAITMVVNINRMSRKKRADKIDEIVQQSSYLEDAVNLVIRTDTDNSTKTDGSPSVIDNSNK
jgi:hypothetical protein